MSVNEPRKDEAPIAPGSPLARVLDGYDVPDLPSGFADRVLAAAEARPAPLPELRRPVRSRRWRIGQRIAIGAASFGALATAAAATGVLEQLAIPVPSAAPSGRASPAMPRPRPSRWWPQPRPPRRAPRRSPSTVRLIRPLSSKKPSAGSTKSALAAARSAARLIDQRIKAEIERRRAAGLRVPTPEEEARLRARIEQVVTAREQRRRCRRRRAA